MLSRRDFSKLLIASSASALPADSWGLRNDALSDQPPEQNGRLDLLIKGGTVIDPGNQWHRLMDVGVRGNKIAEVAKDIPQSRALKVIWARDRIVTPGFIDLQVHCFEGMSSLAVNADHYCLGRGVTTIVSNGAAGYLNIEGYINYIVKPSITRIFTSLNIFPLGVVRPGLLQSVDNLDAMDVTLSAKAILENKPSVVGIKAYIEKEHVGTRDVECLQKALQAAQIAKVPVVADIVGTHSPVAKLVGMLRPGDIFTHAFNGFANGVLDANGRVLPEVLAARDRGIYFDTAQGEDKFNFDVAEKCLQQNLLPDSISTDLYSGNTDSMVFDLPTTVSKFMALGISLDDAIERVTFRPAKMFDFGLKIGTLAPGSEADIAIFELRHGKYDFVGSSPEDKRAGDTLLVSKAVICRGRYFVNAV